uniref:YhcG N-terminal domain-containing protein n=1 Tax=Candidatus Desulfatibia profunda TaxID=2841695 RepID=A0A8J6NJR5_9BACT|nr:hypothetical protein [Candidatus Desulfatibia profunda]
MIQFFSRNLWDMKRFYEQYAAHEKLRQAVAELLWASFCALKKVVRNRKGTKG